MPEANQYLFTNKELLALLIKEAGVHEGKWMLAANIAFSPGNFGPTPDQMSPGAVVAIVQMGIQRAGADTLEQMALDAGVVNPLSKPPSKARRRD
jgi:hypothetical protein